MTKGRVLVKTNLEIIGLSLLLEHNLVWQHRYEILPICLA